MSNILRTLSPFATSSNPLKTDDDDCDHYPICDFQSPSAPTLVIIFVHDILWNGGEQQLHKSTWMSSTNPPVCWPETWLANKYRNAQILSVNYDAAIRKSPTAGYMDIFKLSENLQQDIPRSYVIDTPVFFVGHGCGGSVIKATLIKMQEKQYEMQLDQDALKSRNDADFCRLKSFLENVKGIFYYSVPISGSECADSITNPPSTSALLDNATVLKADTSRLNEKFSKWRKIRKCKTKLLLAALPSRVGYWHGHLAPEGTARYDVDDVYTAGYSNHFDVCKPRSTDDARFTKLVDFIDSTMKSTTKPVPPPPIEDSAKSACDESVKNILKRIQELKERKNRQVLLLRIVELTKIRGFEDLKSSLQESLNQAGFRKTFVSAYFEHYE